MRTFGILLFLTLVCRPALQAQILNIDKVDTSEYLPKPDFNLNLGTGLEVDKQRSTVYDMSNALDASLQRSKELFIFSSSFRFTYNGPNDILNTGYFHLRYRHDYKNTLHPETYVQYQWDTKRGLASRKLGGANLRWNNYLHPRLNLIIATGVFYEQEEWNYAAVDSSLILTGSPDVTTHYLKSNSYIKFELKAGDHSDLFFTTFLQFRPDHFAGHYRIANSIKWEVEISKHFSFDFNFNSLYDPHPVVPIEKFYYSLSNMLLLKF